MARRAAISVKCGLVQAIRLRWTKAARGGEGARARCAVPSAFEVPAADFAGAEGMLCRDVSQWSDSNAFAEPVSTSRLQIPLAEGLTFGCVTVSADAEGLQVRYQYSQVHGGAPNRRSPGPTYLITDREWMRVCYNGRFTSMDTGNWWYQQVTVNVAWFAGQPDWRVFLDRKPVRELRDLADLW